MRVDGDRPAGAAGAGGLGDGVGDPLRFDHGAQYFTARDPRVQRWVRWWEEAGVVARWDARIVEVDRGEVVADKSDTVRYVGVGDNNALARHLARDLTVRTGHRVVDLNRDAHSRWTIRCDDGVRQDGFDRVIINLPPVQAADLIGDRFGGPDPFESFELDPCWTSMVEFDRPPRVDLGGAFVRSGPLGWVSREGSKPGRADGGDRRWVLHARADWSRDHLERDPEDVGRCLVDAFRSAVGGDPAATVVRQINHRWRYSIPRADGPTIDRRCLEITDGLVACGDWLAGGRVEGAILSGIAAAAVLFRGFAEDRSTSGQPV